jgi:hypothetical protein
MIRIIKQEGNGFQRTVSPCEESDEKEMLVISLMSSITI